MSSVKNSLLELSSTQNIHDAVLALQEVSVFRMQKIRALVLKNRQYMDGLLSIFHDLQVSHQEEIEKLLHEKKKWYSFLQKPSWQLQLTQNSSNSDKKLNIFSAPNQRFSAKLAGQVFEKFCDAIKKDENACDILVIGDVGRELFEQHFAGSPVMKRAQCISLKEEKLDIGSLQSVITNLSNYERVDVFHGHFVNLLHQDPHSITLTANDNLSEKSTQLKTAAQETGAHFLFEPSLADIVFFFNHQVFAVLFLLSLHESHLAYLGSRVEALENSNLGLKLRLKKLSRQVSFQRQQIINKKQAQRLAGLRVWK